MYIALTPTIIFLKAHLSLREKHLLNSALKDNIPDCYNGVPVFRPPPTTLRKDYQAYKRKPLSGYSMRRDQTQIGNEAILEKNI